MRVLPKAVALIAFWSATVIRQQRRRSLPGRVTTNAVAGTVTPQVVNFIARSPGGTDYRALPTVSTLRGAPLGPRATASGKIYFDVVGENPDSVIYSADFQDLLGW